ncbi:MAG: GHKL domain-containing protein [Oscillospiraceae bacterium]
MKYFDYAFSCFQFSLYIIVAMQMLRPRFNKVVTYLVAIVQVFGFYIISTETGLVGKLIPGFPISFPIHAFVYIVLWICWFLIFFKGKTSYKFLMFCIWYTIQIILDLLVSLGMEFFTKRPVVDTFNKEFVAQRMIGQAIFMVVYVFVSYFMVAFIKRKEIKVQKQVMTIFGMMMLLEIFLLAFACYSAEVLTMAKAVTMLVFAVAITIFNLFLYKVLLQLTEQAALKEKLFWVENVKSAELQYYESLQSKSLEIRKIRHDFNDQLQTVNLLIENQDEHSTEKAKEILVGLDKALKSTITPVYCDNIVVNTIVGAKIQDAEKKSIEVETLLSVPKELAINTLDLNCVFSNLLNNSIEACEKLEKEKRKIILKATLKADYLIIKIQNPIELLKTDEKGKIKTTKKDSENHGYGMMIIEETAKKYDGDMKVTYDENNFKAVITLKIDEINS